jgi:hypothetical protein|tara:strand:+ start:805 stop:1302 length:498 start_codon:yes stop_codon:yes gene_type:complete
MAKKKTATTISIAKLRGDIIKISRESSKLFVVGTEEAIEKFHSLSRFVPHEHEWPSFEDETFKLLIESLEHKTPSNINRIYLGDILEQFKAYNYFMHWRVEELVAPIIRTLNTNEIVASAVLCRALLELAASYFVNAQLTTKMLGYIPENLSSKKGCIPTLLWKN